MALLFALVFFCVYDLTCCDINGMGFCYSWSSVLTNASMMTWTLTLSDFYAISIRCGFEVRGNNNLLVKITVSGVGGLADVGTR